MMGWDGFVGLLDAARSILGPVRLHLVKEDWKKAFRQLRICPESSRLFCVVAFHPETHKPWIWSPRTVVFGPRSGPTQCCRVTCAVVAILQTFFAIPCDVHVL